MASNNEMVPKNEFAHTRPFCLYSLNRLLPTAHCHCISFFYHSISVNTSIVPQRNRFDNKNNENEQKQRHTCVVHITTDCDSFSLLACAACHSELADGLLVACLLLTTFLIEV